VDRTRAAVLPLSRDDGRATTAIGRDARLELFFERRGARTMLAHAYVEPPFRIGRTFEEHDGVHVIMASSAPGIFDGDTFEQHIALGPGTRVRLTSQSSLQVHPSSTGGVSRIRATYAVGAGAALVCAWHPTIPFAGSHLDQRIDIRLAGEARLSWSDAVTGGRTARGERWACASLRHELAIRRDGVLEYLERWQLGSADVLASHPWAAADCSYLGTVLTSGVAIAGTDVEALHRRLDARTRVCAAGDLLDDRLLLVRRGVPRGSR
jgi:urease accessory protein UreH